MNGNYEKRMLIVFLLSFLVLIGYMYFMPKPVTEPVTVQATNTIQALTNTAAAEPSVLKEISFTNKTAPTNITIAYDKSMFLTIDSLGARVTGIAIDGTWNRKKVPVTLLSPTITYFPGDTTFGSMENLQLSPDRPNYSVLSAGPDNVSFITVVDINGSKLEITKKYSLETNYQFFEEISIKNLAKKPVKLDYNGKSLSVGSSFEFFTKELANSGNPLLTEYLAENKIVKALSGGLFKGREKMTQIHNPKWLSSGDNYFIALEKADSEDVYGKFVLVIEDKMYTEAAMGFEFPSLLLESGEVKNYKISYYLGPKKEAIVETIDKSYKKIFEWFVAFNWFMKPIEWVMYKGMTVLSAVIPNWGIIVMILAIIIKLVLSPLSIKGAVSIKRSNLLQPKIKNLQEKYKDDTKTLNEKIAELYKKEGVNPLGGCFPILLQIPVFFSLYRVLSTSVELKGAGFLWIKDLTQPDTLFKMTLPLLPSTFNLLPIIMTFVQLIQMKLSSMKTPANAQQNAMNTYLLPVVFLFLFWGMPSGLVLYWTIQNLYSIVEQEIINMDKQVKLLK